MSKEKAYVMHVRLNPDELDIVHNEAERLREELRAMPELSGRISQSDAVRSLIHRAANCGS